MANDPETLEVGQGQNGTAPVPQPNPQTVQQPQPQDVSALNGRPPVQEPVLKDPIENHPAVSAAKVIRKVGETIAGGPRMVTTIDPMTGEAKREPKALSTKEILTGALANILGSVGQIGTNLSDRMAGRAPKPIQPLPTQVAQQQQAQQSEEDFNRVQNQKVRQAKVLQANMEAMRSAYALGKEADDAKDSVISNHADDLANWNKAGAVEASNVPSNELMQKGFDKSKYVAIPDGRVPVFNQDGTRATDSNGVPLSQLTYSVVDGTTQAPLSQDKYDQLAKYGLVGTKEGFKLPEGATVSTAQLALLNHKIDLIQQTQREVDEVAGEGKVNLAEQIKKNPQVLTAIEAFHNDGGSTEPDNQINNLQAKKPQLAGLMREVFGNENLEKYKENRLARTKAEATKQEAEAKAEAEARVGPMTTDKANTILARAQSTTQEKQEAQDFLDRERQQKKETKSAELQAQRDQEDRDLSTAARNIVSGDIGRIQDYSSFRGDQKTRINNMIHDEAVAQGKNPQDYTPAKLEAKATVIKDFADGKAADNIMAYNTFLGHANDALDATGKMRLMTGSPLINRPLNWIRKNAADDTNFQQFQVALSPVRSEFNNFLNNNRAEHEADIKQMQTVLSDDASPAQIEASLKQLGKSGDIRLRELGRKYSNTIGQEYPNLYSPEGRQALQRMGITPGATTQNAQPQNNKQQILQSITLPGGGHPVDVKYGPKGEKIFSDGKQWLDPLTGFQPYQPKQ